MEETRLLEQRQKLLNDQAALLQKAENENRDLTDEEQKEYDDRREEIRGVDKRRLRIQEWRKDQESQPQSEKRDAGGNGEEKPGRKFSGSAPQKKPQYSLLRALRVLADKRPLDGWEAEISQELAKRYNKQPQGFFLPWDFQDPFAERGMMVPLPERRDLTTTTGTGAVGTDLIGFIEILRNRMVVFQLGATILTGLQGDVAIPKQTAASTAYWVDNEATAITESNQTIGQITLAPTTCGALTDITRKFLQQSSMDAEAFVRTDLARVIALEIDRACLNGSGTAPEPEGIMQDTNIPTVGIGANGGAPTWAKVVELETNITQDNADLGAMAYVTNAKVIGKMKTVEKASNTAEFLYDVRAGGRPVNGYPCLMTNQIPSNLTKGTGTNLSAMIFGYWASLVVGMWSGLDVIVDPYTGSSQGLLRIVTLQDLDIDFRHDEAFAKCVDIDTS